MSKQYTFPTRTLIALPPAHASPDTIVFNAPRPLCGTRAWTGDFCAGIFYASVSADDPYRAGWIKENKALDATVLLYTDEPTAKQQVRQYLDAEYPGEDISEDLFNDYWKDCFDVNFARGEVEVSA